MSSPRLDPFERFARERALRVTSRELLAMPRDVAAPLEERERFFLVELAAERSDAPVQVVVITPLDQRGPPGTRDALWWLAADAWAVERCDRDAKAWLALHGYPEDSPDGRSLFDLHVGYAAALDALLGRAGFEELLALHRAELGKVTDR